MDWLGRLLFPRVRDYEQKRQMRHLGLALLVGVAVSVAVMAGLLFYHYSDRFRH